MLSGGTFAYPSEKQFLGFAQELGRRGHEVLFAVIGAEETAEGDPTAPGLTVLHWAFRGRRPRPADRAAVKAFAPDVIHLVSPHAHVVAATKTFLADTPGAAVVAHICDDEWGLSGGPAGGSLPRRVARGLKRAAAIANPALRPTSSVSSLDWTAVHADVIEAITPVLAAHATEQFERNVDVLLPVIADAPAGTETPPALPPGPVLLYTGAVYDAHADDFRLGLQALTILRARGHQATLVQAGATLARLHPEKLAREAGLPDGAVVSLGYIPYAQVHALLGAADVLIQPGLRTDFNRLRLPSKIQSYLESGTPTVMYSIGPGELLHDRTETLKTYTDSPEELADRIQELLEDPALRATLADGGPKAAARLFGVQKNTDTLLSLYQRATTG